MSSEARVHARLRPGTRQRALIGPNCGAAGRAGDGSRGLGKAETAAIFLPMRGSRCCPPGEADDSGNPIALRLHRWLALHAPVGCFLPSAEEAGARTADYIIANRTPRPAVLVCCANLPARLAAPLLMMAITKHAWTFIGAGVVRGILAGGGSPLIAATPMIRCCHLITCFTGTRQCSPGCIAANCCCAPDLPFAVPPVPARGDATPQWREHYRIVNGAATDRHPPSTVPGTGGRPRFGTLGYRHLDPAPRQCFAQKHLDLGIDAGAGRHRAARWRGIVERRI